MIEPGGCDGLEFIREPIFAFIVVLFTIGLAVVLWRWRGSKVKQEEMCFIATAAFGSPLAWELKMLRGFRDKVLLKKSLGRIMVSMYYTISPPIAKFIARRGQLRIFVRSLIKPAAKICLTLMGRRYARKTTYVNAQPTD